MKKEKLISPFELVAILIRRRYLFIKTFIMTVIFAVVVSLLLRNQYTAKASILPPNLQQDAFLNMFSPGTYSTYGGLTGLGGMLPGTTSPSDLFAAILASGKITGNIINEFNLLEVFKCKKASEAAKTLKEITKIGVTPEGIVSVSVTWYDKYLAADLANAYIEELNKFNTETAMTTGKKYRLFIEERVKSVSDSLLRAEEAFRDFQEKHKTVALDIEVQSIIETVAKLKSQMILLEVKKGALGSTSQANNPYVYKINNEIRELRKQLAKIEKGEKITTEGNFGAGFSVPLAEVPEVSLEYARLLRDVKVQEAIYELLNQQYEQAKIMELKDTPTVQILDKASPPDKKSSPKRSRIVILAGVLSIIISIVASILLESFDRFKNYDENYVKWVKIFTKLKNDYITMKKNILDILKNQKK
ncbi:MAG: GNVR domain-containing protein [bacterium]